MRRRGGISGKWRVESGKPIAVNRRFPLSTFSFPPPVRREPRGILTAGFPPGGCLADHCWGRESVHLGREASQRVCYLCYAWGMGEVPSWKAQVGAPAAPTHSGARALKVRSCHQALTFPGEPGRIYRIGWQGSIPALPTSGTPSWPARATSERRPTDVDSFSATRWTRFGLRLAVDISGAGISKGGASSKWRSAIESYTQGTASE